MKQENILYLKLNEILRTNQKHVIYVFMYSSIIYLFIS